MEPSGKFIERVWEPNPSALGGRRSRAGGTYRAFVPAKVSERSFDLNGSATLAIAEATRSLARLDSSPDRMASLKAVAGNLLRSESAASSRIEGFQISQRRLARVAFSGSTGRDHAAVEILGNVEAMRLAVELGAARRSFTLSDLEAIHERLLRFSSGRKIAGRVRDRQNWIGGNDYNPLGADYVPPPPGEVPALLKDLCAFINREDLAPVVQAAITHAQFENIHPFADGNGRVGRALIYVVLRRRGEIGDYIPPISLVLGSKPKGYIQGLVDFRQGNVSDWCETFARSTQRAAAGAERLAEDVEALEQVWLERLGNPRRDSTARLLVAALSEQPVIDVATAKERTGRSHVAVQNALLALEGAGIISPLSERKWGRVWECPEIFNLVEDLERAERE